MFVLGLLKGVYRGAYRPPHSHSVSHDPIQPSVPRYHLVWADSEVYVVDPGERLHDYLRAFYTVFKGEPTLYVIDDCSASKAITKNKDTSRSVLAKKKNMLSELAFSGRHAQQSVWVLTQKYNSVLTDLHEQARWVAIFHCKDRDSFNECLRENDIVPPEE